MMIVNSFGIRSERRLREEEVHLNLAYQRFCRLDLSDPIPNQSPSSKNRHALPDRRLPSNLPRGALSGKKTPAASVREDRCTVDRGWLSEWPATGCLR